MDSQKFVMNPPKRSRRSTPSTRRTGTHPEESSLINGLKELCVNGWRADSGTFRPRYLMELEHYLRECHPDSGLKGEPHINSKLKAWKKSYASISLLKSQSGLRFQYSDGTILVDDPNEWEKFVKDDSGARNMNTKKWPMFANWEEIFGKDRATGEYAEGPLDVVEDIVKNQTSGVSSDMSLEFLIDVDEDECENEASHGPNAPTQEAKNAIRDLILLECLKMNMLQDLLMNILKHLERKVNILKELLAPMKKRKAKKEKGLERMLMKHFSRLWQKL